MTGEIFARILINETERKEIEKVISVMSNIFGAYEETGLQSVGPLLDTLTNGVALLEEILKENDY